MTKTRNKILPPFFRIPNASYLNHSVERYQRYKQSFTIRMPKIHLGLFIKYNKCKPHNHKFSYIRQQWPLVHLINSLLNIKVVRFDSSITCPAIAFDHKKIGQDHCTGIMSGVGQY